MTPQEIKQAFVEAIKETNGLGSSGRIGGGGGGSADRSAADMEKDLRNLSTQAKDVEANIKKLNKTFLPFSGSMATAQKLHGQMSRDLDAINQRLEDLDQSLQKSRDGFEKISPATKKAMEEEQKKLKAMKATVEFETQKRESVGNVFGALGNISDAYQEIARASVAGMESISSAIQQGGSGFNLLGAAAEYQADMAKAQANMGASAMASVGQSMQGLGLAGQVAGGALNFLAQQVQHNAELRRAAARIRNQLFMNMGEKFSQSFMAAAGAGAVFAGGATAMNAALDGSRITMSEFGELVKRNNVAFANSGVSMERLTRQVGATSAAFKKSGVDTQLMKLGLSFQEQSDIIVETASQMNRLAIQTGGAGASQADIAAAAEQSARNTAFMAQILGEEAKTREKANKEATAALAYKQKENEMSMKIGAGAAANQTKVIDQGLPPEMRKAFNQMLAYGTVTDKDTAATLEQNPAAKKMLYEMRAAYLAGKLQDANQFGAIAGKYSKDINATAQSNKALANAGMVGTNQTVNAMARMTSDFMTFGVQFSPEKIVEATSTTEKPKPGEKPAKPKDPLGDAIVNAAVTMNNFQKDMEKYVVNNLPSWSAAMQKSLQEMKDAYEGKVGGLNPLADKFAWLTEFMSKYGLVVMLAAQAIAILMAMAKLAGAALGKIGAQGEMAKLKSLTDKPEKKPRERHAKGTIIEGKNVGGQFKKADSLEAPGGGKKPGLLSRAKEAYNAANATPLAKLAGVAAPLMAIAGGAMNFMAGQKDYEAAQAAGDKEGMAEARAAQGEGIGGAVGGVAGGAIGFALGGPIGAAVGSYLGEMAGGALGKYIGPYWDDMSKKAGEMWAGTKEAVSKGWASFSTGVGELLSSMWKGIKEGWNWIMGMFATIGKSIWNAIQQTPLFKLGSYIITGIAGAASGMATAMINGLKSAFDWMKTTIGNLIPDWMKNAANKVGGAISDAYNYVTGKDKPTTAAPTAPAASSKPPAASKPPSAEPTLSEKQIQDFAYSIFVGKNSINDVPAKYRDQVSRLVKNPPANWKPAQPSSPSATTGKATPPDARQQQNAATSKPGDSKPAAPTPTGPKAPESSAKSGTVTEKDIPRLLQESLKMAEYNAKGTERMVSIMASIADLSKRTATAAEKTARG